MAGYSRVKGWEGVAETVGEVYDDLGSRVDTSSILPSGWKPGWPQAHFMLWRTARGLLVLGVSTYDMPVRPYPSNALRVVLDMDAPYSSVLHLAAHVLCGGLEVSRHGNYHNALFRRAVGLLGEGYDVAYHKAIGWAVPALDEEHFSTLGHLLLFTAVREAARSFPIEPIARTDNRTVYACSCGRKILASSRELDRGGILCASCGHTFKQQLEPTESGGRVRLERTR